MFYDEDIDEIKRLSLSRFQTMLYDMITYPTDAYKELVLVNGTVDGLMKRATEAFKADYKLHE